MATTKRRRTRKNKYITLYSPFLMQETKHELIGDPIEGEEGRQQWARCTKSHHSQLVNLDTLEAESAKEEVVVEMNKEDSVAYNPKDEYKIGDILFHEAWDDLGLVKGKEITSSGGHAIVVDFEKNKVKRLVEMLGK